MTVERPIEVVPGCLRGSCFEPHALAALICLLVATQAGCASLWQTNLAAQRRERAERMEPLLEQAGFQRLAAETEAQKSELNSLPALTISRSVGKKGTRYWFADPYVCGCVYAGNEATYQRYLQVVRAKQAAEEMRASHKLNWEEFYQVSQAREMEMFNPVFEP